MSTKILKCSQTQSKFKQDKNPKRIKTLLKKQSYGKDKKSDTGFSQSMISGTSLSNCKVVVIVLDDSNIGGCHHDTEDEAPGYKYDTENANLKKRYQTTAPKLTDYNKKQLERNLFASQYDQKD